jgi:hypothetical protein
MRTARFSGCIAVAVVLAVISTEGTASAGLMPAKRTVTVQAGKTAKAHFAVDARPPVDVALLFDTTGSLGENLAEARDAAADIVTDIQSHIPDTRFAVAQFKDKGDNPEYRVEQSMTPSGSKVSAAVGRLTSRGGGDLPEAYNLAFTKSFTPAAGGPLGWRNPSRKFVVVIGDAEPHGAGAAGIEGCEDRSADPHGLNTAAVLSSLSAAGRTLVMVHLMNHHAVIMKQIPASFECYQGLAKAAGGVAVEGHHDELHHSIVHAVTDLVPAPNPGAALKLKVVGASPKPASRKWVVRLTQATADHGGGEHGADITEFVVSIRPPRRTKPGTYRLHFVALANGVDVGHSTVNVEVLAGKSGHQTPHH